MSIKTRENLNVVSEIQQQRQSVAKEAVDRIIRDTPAQISTEMYARHVAYHAFADGWNAKADDVADELARLRTQLEDAERRVKELERQNYNSSLDEALNMGDGTYKP